MINFGNAQDVSLTHVTNSGLQINSTNKIIFGNATEYINAGASNALNMNAAGSISITSAAASNFTTTTGGITSSGDIVTSGNIVAEQYIVSSSISIITQSFSSGSTIFGDTPVDDTHQFTGSVFVNSATTSSTAIFADNIQAGYPTSNQWKSNLVGSYFNNFDNTTHVSEILRLDAGVLSHSLDVADASPNTKTFGSVDTNENNLGSTDSINGYVPTNYSAIGNTALGYLVPVSYTHLTLPTNREV